MSRKLDQSPTPTLFLTFVSSSRIASINVPRKSILRCLVHEIDSTPSSNRPCPHHQEVLNFLPASRVRCARYNRKQTILFLQSSSNDCETFHPCPDLPSRWSGEGAPQVDYFGRFLFSEIPVFLWIATMIRAPTAFIQITDSPHNVPSRTGNGSHPQLHLLPHHSKTINSTSFCSTQTISTQLNHFMKLIRT